MTSPPPRWVGRKHQFLSPDAQPATKLAIGRAYGPTPRPVCPISDIYLTFGGTPRKNVRWLGTKSQVFGSRAAHSSRRRSCRLPVRGESRCAQQIIFAKKSICKC